MARVHERIANRRTNFAHQHSRKIACRFRLIAVEDLSVNPLVHHHCLAKSIHDAAWSPTVTLGHRRLREAVAGAEAVADEGRVPVAEAGRHLPPG
ncbi:MAG TPA: hypothetical protein VNL71_04680, partial [Chloroflexota bacterium]|nr:hypothetical protein [Chloroflexota bacterium]